MNKQAFIYIGTRAASCKSQQEKITQQENTFLGKKMCFLVELFFLV